MCWAFPPLGASARVTPRVWVTVEQQRGLWVARIVYIAASSVHTQHADQGDRYFRPHPVGEAQNSWSFPINTDLFEGQCLQVLLL